MRRGPTVLYRIPGGLLLLALASFAAAPAGAAGQWQSIARAENRVVFASDRFDAYEGSHIHLPLKATHYVFEVYAAFWGAGVPPFPVFSLVMVRPAPGRSLDANGRKSLEDAGKTLEEEAKGQKWARGLAFAAGGSGVADSVLGPAAYLFFTAGDRRCAIFRRYLNDENDPDRPDNIYLTGFYCPPFGALDRTALDAVLARIGIRDIAVPEPPPADGLAALIAAGDLAGLRRIGGLDPDAAIGFSHPRFAGGRTVRRPMIVAAALFGRAATVAWLIERGASLAGRSSGAICAAIAGGHGDVVERLLTARPALARYPRCGRGRNLAAGALARRLGHAAIAERLEAGPR